MTMYQLNPPGSGLSFRCRVRRGVKPTANSSVNLGLTKLKLVKTLNTT